MSVYTISLSDIITKRIVAARARKDPNKARDAARLLLAQMFNDFGIIDTPEARDISAKARTAFQGEFKPEERRFVDANKIGRRITLTRLR